MKIIYIFTILIFLNIELYSQNFIEIYPELQSLSYSMIDFIDYNNDGFQDIFICGREAIILYKNKGNGYIEKVDENVIQIPEFYDKFTIEYDEPRFAWADFNNDGYIDLALQARFKINDKYEPYLLIYQNLHGKLKRTNSLPGVLGNIDWGDYDNDGDLDIITTGRIYNWSIHTKIFKNNNGKFNEISNNILGVSGGIIKWIDIDNDGYKDVLISGWRDDGLFSGIYKNIGNGFNKVDFEIKKLYWSDADVLDFNKDGYQDFVLTGLGDNNEIHTYLYLNNKNKKFISINLSSYGILPLYGGSIQLADFNHDGEYDVLISGKAKTNEYRVDLYKNYGSLNFKKIELNIPGIYFGDAIFKDFDLDGFLDIGITGYSNKILGATTKIYLNSNNDQWDEYGIKDVFDAYAVACDFDNDHDYDLLIGGKTLTDIPKTFLYENRGNNKFIRHKLDLLNLYNQNGTNHFSLLDFNGDNLIDFVISGTDKQGNSKLRLYENKGNFNFIETSKSIGLKDTPANSSILIIDYDKDGDQDIITTNGIYENKLGKKFLEHNLNFETVAGTDISSADIDLDGDFDIFSFKITSSGFWSKDIAGTLYENNGLFNLSKILEIQIGSTSSNPVATKWGDYDNDGYPDLFLAGRIYRNLMGDTLIDINAGLDEYTEGDVKWGDLDNDGDLDLVYSGRAKYGWGSYNYYFEFYRNDGYGTFTKVDYGFSEFNNGAIILFDYDNDSDLDILYVGQESFTRLYENKIPEKNTPPGIPSGLISYVYEDSIVLKWEKATDKETPSNGLTYNIAVRKQGSSSWIVSPMADTTDGYRYVVDNGNVGHKTKWVLRNLSPGTYYWRVQAIDNCFAGSKFSKEEKFIVGTTAIENYKSTITNYKLLDNYPNPFNPTTTIVYELPIAGYVEVTVYNSMGKKIRTLVNTRQAPGHYKVKWDGRDEQGKLLPSGIYLYRLKTKNFQQTKKMILLK